MSSSISEKERLLPKYRQKLVNVQVSSGVDAGRRVHHGDWPRTRTAISGGRSYGVGHGAVGCFSDSRSEVFDIQVGWRRIGLT